jgi:hypothetical protein
LRLSTVSWLLNTRNAARRHYTVQFWERLGVERLAPHPSPELKPQFHHVTGLLGTLNGPWPEDGYAVDAKRWSCHTDGNLRTNCC